MDWLTDEALNAPQSAADTPARTPPRHRGPRHIWAIASLAVAVVAAAMLPRLWAAPVPAAAPSRAGAPSVEPTLVPITAPPATAGPEASEQAEPEYLPPETQQRLLDTAEAAMKAFARPTKKKVTRTQWFTGLRRYLTGEAAEAYESTDPRKVPFTRITRPVTMGPIVDEADLTRCVDVATNAGPYRVWISMLDYRVEAFQPLGD